MSIIEFLTGDSQTVASVIWPIVLGAFLAIVISHFNKRTVGILVKRLLQQKATDEENAVLLSSLKIRGKAYLFYALRDNSVLRSIIHICKGSDKKDPKLFIPEDKLFRAESQYKPDGSSLYMLIISAAVLFALGFALITFLPDFISALKETF